MSGQKSREDLVQTVDEAEWQWLKPHLERGALITVVEPLDLVEAGEKIANDDTEAVNSWISAGRIGKPTAAEIACWNDEPAKKFLVLIVSPYVLIQEIGTVN